MCGIIGMVAEQEFTLKEAFGRLKKLEYRGYDSFGYFDGNLLIKKVGAIQIPDIDKKTKIAILHTRWSTHGGVTEANAHPHVTENKEVAVVHNGIIDNYIELKAELEKKGHIFTSQTDSEVLAHYIEEQLKTKKMQEIMVDFFNDIKGQFALLVIIKGDQNLYAFKRDSPLCLGLAKNHMILASDVYAFADTTQKAIFFDDDECAIICGNEYRIFNKKLQPIKKEIVEFEFASNEGEKKEYPHYMIKEIMEQPERAQILLNSAATAQKEKFFKAAKMIKAAGRVLLVGIGTSYHAAKFGEKVFTRLGIDAMAQNAADISPVYYSDDALVIPISQSGETMDVIKELKVLKERYPEMKIVSILNVPYSTLQRMSDMVLECLAGPEICVASTKAFTNQCLSLLLIARELGLEGKLESIPPAFNKTLSLNQKPIEKLTEQIKTKQSMFVLGNLLYEPIALEVALKIKEIAYIHAEGLQSRSLKHGPLALITDGVPVINFLYNNEEFTISNMKEVESRGAFTIITSNKEPLFKAKASFIIPVENEYIFALCSNLIGQILTYEMAKSLNLPIDKPRNLAKSVTVV